MRLGPDTALNNVWIRFNHHGGYYDRDSHIRVFSHTHYVGCGGADWGNFGVMVLDRPIDNELVTYYGYKSEFDNEAQVLYPGYYSVPLPTHNAFAELTVAGNFTGVHRYTFASTATPKTILIDVCHALESENDRCVVASANIDLPSNFLTAHMLLRGSGTGRSPRGGVDVYFCARFFEGTDAATKTGWGVWKENVVYPNLTFIDKIEGQEPSLGMYVEFAATTTSIHLVAAISFISIAQACENLAVEMGSRTTFDQVVSDAVAVWESQLSILSVTLRDVQSDDDAVELYTAFYRSLQSPTIYTEANRQYIGFDGAAHTSPPGATRFSDMSLWDTFRTRTSSMSLFSLLFLSSLCLCLADVGFNGGRAPVADSVPPGCCAGMRAVPHRHVAGGHRSAALAAGLARHQQHARRLLQQCDCRLLVQSRRGWLQRHCCV